MSKASNTKLWAIILVVIIIVSAGAVAIWWFFFVPKTPPSNPYQVAIVFATGGLGDKSFNDGCYLGAVDARTDFGAEFTYVEPTAQSEYEPFLRQYAAHIGVLEPYDIIIGIGFDQADAIMAVATDYPDQAFAIVDMWIDPGTYPNVASILFAEEEGSALVGALAGLYTASDKIGFVGGMDIPLIRKFAAGYFWGANITNPAIGLLNATKSPNVDNAWVGDWADPTLAESLADGLYTAGFDIVFAAAGRSGLGVIDSAKKNNATIGPIWAIGVDQPQMFLGTADPENPAAPTAVLTSMIKRVDLAVYEAIEAAVDIGTPFTGVQYYSLANGGVGWERNETLLGWNFPQSVLDDVDEIETGIINGTYTVPIDYVWL